MLLVFISMSDDVLVV